MMPAASVGTWSSSGEQGDGTQNNQDQYVEHDRLLGES